MLHEHLFTNVYRYKYLGFPLNDTPLPEPNKNKFLFLGIKYDSIKRDIFNDKLNKYLILLKKNILINFPQIN